MRTLTCKMMRDLTLRISAQAGLAAALAIPALAGDTFINPADKKPLFTSKQLDSRVLKECEEQGRLRGGEFGGSVNAHCFDDFLAAASKKTIRINHRQDIFAVGHKNILFINTLDSGGPDSRNLVRNIIAGKYTKLKDIQALSIDSKTREVFVLDASGSVLPFSADLTGNVAPRRTLKSDLIEGASSVVVNPSAKEILVVHGPKAALYFYRIKADIEGRTPETSTALLRSVSGSSTQMVHPEGAAIDERNGEIFVIDRDGHQVLVFDSIAEGDVAPKRVIRGALTTLSSPQVITVNREIEVVNGDGSILRFPKDASGDASPLK